MITNGRTIGQTTKIKQSQIEHFFDVIVISETEGIKKPDPQIFQRCLARLNVTADKALYIGDSPGNDIAPAHALGMQTIWVDHGIYEAPEAADGTIHAINKLLDIL